MTQNQFTRGGRVLTEHQRNLVEQLATELDSGLLGIFAGAGMSVGSGFADWKTLLAPLAREINIDIQRESDLVALAQYHFNENGMNRGGINQIILDEFSKQAHETENHRILARLPIETYWTTNYDKLIEKALEKQRKVPDVKHESHQLQLTKRDRDAVVYKMHGDVDHPSGAVITKDDYSRYHVKHQPFINALAGDMATKTLLFLGFSFTDPNLDYVLSRIRATFAQDQRRHYCILRKESRQDGDSDADFQHRQRKQELFVNDLKRFNIRTTFVDTYDQITEILKELEWRHRKRFVFISGAAHEYGRWDSRESQAFIHSLSKGLIEAGFRIVSGFGLGVGGPVITGALEAVYMAGKNLEQEQLLLRPFPQEQVGTRNRVDIWTDYRRDMISRAGVAIFLFGNKVDNSTSNVVQSTGMIEEMRIAMDLQLKLIPVASTGYASKAIHDLLRAEGSTNGTSLPDALTSESSDLSTILPALITYIKSL